jgi:LPXTG-motif cell wall-anchored protein
VESSEISEKEHFPTLLAVVAVTVTGVVIIAVGFLVYFKKRKH